MLEPVLLGAAFVSLLALLPILWECKPVPAAPVDNGRTGSNATDTFAGLELYICKPGHPGGDGGVAVKTYNEMASLAFNTGEDTVRQLLSREANQVTLKNAQTKCTNTYQK